MSEPEIVDCSDAEEPTNEASVTIEVSKKGGRAIFPAKPTKSLIQLVAYMVSGVGAVAGPTLTIEAASTHLSGQDTTVIVVLQILLLAGLALVSRFRAEGDAR